MFDPQRPNLGTFDAAGAVHPNAMGKLVLAAVAACAAIQICAAKADIIRVMGSIQAAVNAANPGDVIFVPPGTYHETVTVLKNNIAITGPKTAIIDASNFANGIHVGAAHFSPGPSPVCPATAVRNFSLNGLTIQNARQNGIFLSGVDGYAVAGGSYIDNGDYGVYPSCSENGQILDTYAQGGEDTCLYVGNDVSVSLAGNRAVGCTVGIQIVNSSKVSIKDNTVQGNSAGILAIALAYFTAAAIGLATTLVFGRCIVRPASARQRAITARQRH